MSDTIGDRLRSARANRGVEIEEVEERTKIRARFLRAIEEDRWEVLPAPVYARGFLRAYAEYLGLDAEELVERYRLEREPAAAASIADSFSEGSAEEGRAEPIPDFRPAGGAKRPGAGGGLRLAGIVAAVAAVALIIVLALSSGGDDEEPAGGAAEVSEEGSDGAETSTEAEPRPERVRVELAAIADVWVCMVDQDGEPLLDGVTVPAGAEEGPFRARRVYVTLGNGQVELSADGEPVEVLDAAEPQGFRLSANGTRELDSTEQPTCS